MACCLLLVNACCCSAITVLVQLVVCGAVVGIYMFVIFIVIYKCVAIIIIATTYTFNVSLVCQSCKGLFLIIALIFIMCDKKEDNNKVNTNATSSDEHKMYNV